MLVQYIVFPPLAVFVAFGAACAVAAVGLTRKIAACRRWPTVTGKVMSTRIDGFTEDDDSEPRSVKHAVFAAIMAAGFGSFALAFVAAALRTQ